MDREVVVQTLRELGLTRTEAETYLGTITGGFDKPVSAYQVAQILGKDPANMSKTLLALERVGAVRAIQEKPRLYVPIVPQDFTENLLAGMKDKRNRVLEHLRDLQTALPAGVPLALTTPQLALEKAAQLLSRCREELLLFADTGLARSLGTALEALAISSDVRVRFLGTSPLEMAGLEQVIAPDPSALGIQEACPWLQLVVDRETWLVASFPSDGGEKSPVGWWCRDAGAAGVMAASLSAAFSASIIQDEIPAPEETSTATEMVFEGGVIPEVNTEAEAAPDIETFSEPVPPQNIPEDPQPLAPEPVEETSDEDGLTFLIQHDQDDEDDTKIG